CSPAPMSAPAGYHSDRMIRRFQVNVNASAVTVTPGAPFAEQSTISAIGQPRVVTTMTIRPAAAMAATVGPSAWDTATSTRTLPLVSGGAAPATVAVIVTGRLLELACGSDTPARLLGGTTTRITASPGLSVRA